MTKMTKMTEMTKLPYNKWTGTEEGEKSLERAIETIAEGNGTYIDDLMWEDYLGSMFYQADTKEGNK